MPRLKIDKAQMLVILMVISFFAVASSMMWWGSSQTEKFRQKAEYEIGLSREFAEYMSDHTCLKMTSTERVKCINDIIDDRRAVERNEEELVSQKETALWSGIMGIATLMGILSGTIGIYLVWITFQETKAANEISRKQATPHLRLTDKTCNLENEIFSDGFVPVLSMRIFNMGPTPAMRVAMTANLTILEDNKIIYQSSGFAESSDSAVAPGDYIQNFFVYLNDSASEAFDAFKEMRKLKLKLETQISYHDIFGNIHENVEETVSRRYNRNLAHAAASGKSGYNTTALFS